MHPERNRLNAILCRTGLSAALLVFGPVMPTSIATAAPPPVVSFDDDPPTGEGENSDKKDKKKEEDKKDDKKDKKKKRGEGKPEEGKPGDGKLEDLEEDAAHGGKPSHPEDEDDWFVFMMADLAVKAGPQVLFGVPDSDVPGAKPFLSTGFSPWPYAQTGGLYSRNSTRNLSMHFLVGAFQDMDDVDGYLTSLRISPHQVVGFEFQYARFHEDFHTGTSTLQITNFFADYYRVREENWALWWGVGAKHVSGRYSQTGFALNLGAEVYPLAPLSLAFHANVGFMNASTLPEYMATMRLHFGPIVPYAGYRSWSTGSTTIGTVTAGLETYF